MRRGRWVPRVMAVAVVVGLGVIVFLWRDELELSRVIENERRLRELIAARPWEAFAVGFSVYAIVSVFPGATGKAAVAGWLFGFWPGIVMVLGGLTLAGAVGFTVARVLIRDSLRGAFGLRFVRFDELVRREGVFYLLTLRLLHVPFTLVNYLSGVSEVRMSTFLWTTAVGLVPGTVVLVNLGARLPSLRELVDRGLMSVIDPTILAALAATALIPWVMRQIVEARRRSAVAPGGAPSDRDEVGRR